MRGAAWSDLTSVFPEDEAPPDTHGHVARARQLCAGSNREVEGTVPKKCPVCERGVRHRTLTTIHRAGRQVDRYMILPHQDLPAPEREAKRPRIRTAVEEE